MYRAMMNNPWLPIRKCKLFFLFSLSLFFPLIFFFPMNNAY